MDDQVTLAQLAAEMAQLRRQMEQVNQRLDMIYGAVTRLAEARPEVAADGSNLINKQPPAPPSAPSNTPLSARMVMDPGNMLASLHQYAVNLGLDVSSAAVERLKTELPAGETKDELG